MTPPRTFTRRAFGLAAAGAAAAWLPRWTVLSAQEVNDGRLTPRPRIGVKTTLKSGPLGLPSDGRDGVVQIPENAAGPLPAVLFLHGATQSGAAMLRRIGPAAQEAGVAVIAPDSRDGTWDAIRGHFGEDVTYLNRVLDYVFDRLNVDPARLVIGGFSDGASYALSLGLVNGDLFPKVIACSPGFIFPGPAHGKPAFFFSHGTSDPILPIDECSRVIVPNLRAMGYNVAFREFDGRHELPPSIASEALQWVAAKE
jgi:phospholipase/carboxylesterase